MKIFGPYMVNEEELEEGAITFKLARAIGKALGVNWKRVSIDEFRRGLEVEFEHADTVNWNMKVVGKIVLDHLREDPLYYTHLAEIE